MADPNLRMRFFGDSADAERALVALEKKYEALQGQIKGATAASRRGSKGMGDQLAGVAMKVASAATAFLSLGTIITGVIQKNDKFIESIDRLIEKLPGAELRLQVQGGLNDAELKTMTATIDKQLAGNPAVSRTQALEIQRELISSGARQNDIDSGEGLAAVMDVMMATNLTGREVDDPSSMVAALAQILISQGRDVSAENMRSFGGKAAQTFEGSRIQMADFTELAQVSAGMTKQGVTENEQISAFSVMTDPLGATAAKTQLKAFTTRLRAAADVPAKAQALESLGLAPEDVDFIGESFSEALGTLTTAYNAADEKTRSSALLKLFGEEGMSGAAVLLGDREKFDTRMGRMEGPALERGRQLYLNSPVAGRQRLENEKAAADAAILAQWGGVGRSDIANAIEAVGSRRRSQGDNGLVLSYEQFELEQLLKLETMGGNSPLQGLANIASASGFGGPMARETIKALDETGVIQESAIESKELLQLLRDIRANTRPVFNRNPQGE